jgi:hypothetical protein
MASTGLLPVLQAFMTRQSAFDVCQMDAASIERAIENGFGPLIAHVSRDRPAFGCPGHAESVRAADLTARVLTAELHDALESVLAIADTIGCRPILLKGGSTALRYYPEPHLRTMGDLDLLVDLRDQHRLEAALRAQGFRETGRTAAAARYVGHHHSIPLRHPEFDVWLEIHSRPHSRRSPLGDHPRFSADAIATDVTTVPFRGREVRVQSHERQLVYTSTRWAEYPSPQRGAFPVLDAALLVVTAGHEIDWAFVLDLVGRTWAATALKVMLGYLEHSRLAAVPPEVMRKLGEADRFTNAMLMATLHRFVTAFVMEGRPFSTVLTPRNRRSVWTTMVGPAAPATKLWTVPLNVAFPDGRNGRFDMALAKQRLWSMARRVSKR